MFSGNKDLFHEKLRLVVLFQLPNERACIRNGPLSPCIQLTWLFDKMTRHEQLDWSRAQAG